MNFSSYYIFIMRSLQLCIKKSELKKISLLSPYKILIIYDLLLIKSQNIGISFSNRDAAIFL
ncbi:MAG TPA: hypothetical protein DCE78_03170 [Bacteroidetes bacterium]|nr:hypothetical protein [Bacteroidota bacterium]